MNDKRFTQEEIEDAQDALDFYPANSAYWDSFTAQDHLEVIHELGLQRISNTECNPARRIDGSIDPYLA